MAQVTRAIVPYQFSQNPADLSANVRSLQDYFSDATVDVVFGTITATTITGAVIGNVTGNVTGSSGTCTGNAATATILATARAINGVNFDGSAAITVTAAAGTLSGTTLAAGVVTSSLTSVGSLGATTISTINLTGGQITFPATQSASSDANTLDDYEEGTWTPADGSGASLSFTVYDCTYVKIGKLVHIEGSITYPVTASGADSRIDGLPFNSRVADDNTGGFAISKTNYSAKAFTVLVLRNTNDFVFNDTTNTQLTNANLSTKMIAFSGSYTASA